MNPKRALIFGVTGQDGSYLSEHLVRLGYKVFGVCRRTSFPNTQRLVDAGVLDDSAFKLCYGDLNDSGSIRHAIREARPDEIYNLAAQSHVQISFTTPEYTTDIDATGVIRLLDAIRDEAPDARFYQASSSEMFGKVQQPIQSETTPFYPRSPYGCAKVFSHWATINYRESYNLFACSGILFNHESPRRGLQFVTRKITMAAARIAAGKQDKLFLGNLDAKRDWGFAGDYVKAMHAMLQTTQPEDFVIATGKTWTVRYFAKLAFEHFQLDWLKHIEVDTALFRPSEVDLLIGDASKAERKLGWIPETNIFKLVQLMCESDRKIVNA